MFKHPTQTSEQQDRSSLITERTYSEIKRLVIGLYQPTQAGLFGVQNQAYSALVTFSAYLDCLSKLEHHALMRQCSYLKGTDTFEALWQQLISNKMGTQIAVLHLSHILLQYCPEEGLKECPGLLKMVSDANSQVASDFIKLTFSQRQPITREISEDALRLEY